MTTSTSFRSSALMGAIRSTLVAASLGTAVAASHAMVVFDSMFVLPGVASQTNENQSFVGTGGNPTITELGDIITLAGVERRVNSVSVRMAQQTFTGLNPYTANITFSIYSVNTLTLATSLLSAVTNNVQISSTGLFDLTFAFNNVTVPDTIFYGVSVGFTNPNINGLGMGLWDYWSPGLPNFGDGQTLPVGTDPGTIINGPSSVETIVYGRLLGNNQLIASTNNGLGVNFLSLGYTPNVQISVVPEPETYALMALGLLAVGAMARRRKQAGATVA